MQTEEQTDDEGGEQPSDRDLRIGHLLCAEEDLEVHAHRLEYEKRLDRSTKRLAAAADDLRAGALEYAAALLDVEAANAPMERAGNLEIVVRLLRERAANCGR